MVPGYQQVQPGILIAAQTPENGSCVQQTLEALDVLFEFAEKYEAANTLAALRNVLIHLTRECPVQRVGQPG
jgi:hypothetical protein